jgi:hypothetical protein
MIEQLSIAMGFVCLVAICIIGGAILVQCLIARSKDEEIDE